MQYADSCFRRRPVAINLLVSPGIEEEAKQTESTVAKGLQISQFYDREAEEIQARFF